MKKILSLVLAALMIFSVVPAAFAAETSAANGDSAYREALDFLATVGFYKGGAGVADKDDITRWQMALFVSRLVTGQIDDSYWATTENDSGFADVAKMEGYQKGAIAFAAAQGIITGYDETTFGPNDGITYRDALVMTVRALGTSYAASGYPWSYIAKARELGLMDGINGIGWTDELSREVVAQILYNAFFTEIDGETIAEEVFGVAFDTIVITASKNVKYESTGAYINATDKAGNNYVQFAVVDETLEPAGTKYHVLGKDLGLKDVAAQNAAVGLAYNVYHKNNFSEILLYEDLNTLYKNEGTANNIVYGGSGSERYITLAGVATRLVAQFTNLNNASRPAASSSVVGNPEAKLYTIGEGASQILNTTGSTYVLYPDGWIYKIADLSPVGYYSEYLDAWYTYDAANNTYAPMAVTHAIYKDLHGSGATGGFKLWSSALTGTYYGGASPYAEAIGSDLTGDGIADRIILKNYKFGYFTGSAAKFTLKTGPKSSSPELNLASINKFANTEVTDGTGYRFTGLTPASGSYVIYWIDNVNKELDVIEVVNQKSDKTTDTYWSRGYVLGFFQSQNKIYIDDGNSRAPLDLGLQAMFAFGSPLYPFGWNATATSTAAYNNQKLIDVLTPFVEQYVKYVVLDGRVVYLENATATNDYVIVDSFAEVDETGIKVNAWSTVTNKYDVINVAEFNGWDIGGFDWQAYWQAGLFQAMMGGSFNITDYISKFVPVKAGEIYKVVYNSGADYNLTDAGAPAVSDNAVFSVKDGYIHNIKGGVYKADAQLNTNETYYTATAANDFWLVRVVEELANGGTKTIKTYGRVGKMGNVSFNGVDIYKATANDYVISGTEAQLADFLAQAGFVDSEIKYVIYDYYTNGLDNDWWLTQNNAYSSRYMWDILANAWTNVKFDMTKLSEIREALARAPKGTIYLVVDGMLYSTDAVDMAEVAQYVKTAKTFNHTGLVTIDLASANGAAILEAVQEQMDTIFYPNLDTATYDFAAVGYAGLKFIGINEAGVYKNFAGNASGAAANFGTLTNVTLYVFYNANQTATVLVDHD